MSTQDDDGSSSSYYSDSEEDAGKEDSSGATWESFGLDDTLIEVCRELGWAGKYFGVSQCLMTESGRSNEHPGKGATLRSSGSRCHWFSGDRVRCVNISQESLRLFYRTTRKNGRICSAHSTVSTRAALPALCVVHRPHKRACLSDCKNL